MHMGGGLIKLRTALLILHLWQYLTVNFGPGIKLKFYMQIPTGPKIACIKYQLHNSMYMVWRIKKLAHFF